MYTDATPSDETSSPSDDNLDAHMFSQQCANDPHTVYHDVHER